MRLCFRGHEVRGRFATREAAEEFRVAELASRLGWPREPLGPEPIRSPLFDHSEELERQKEYVFTEARGGGVDGGGLALSAEQIHSFNSRGFLIGLPVLEPTELAEVRASFDETLRARVDKATSQELKFRAAHTLPRPLHQALVVLLAGNDRILKIVEDILGPQFVCWSAHLFCKLPGDETVQPFHQDAGFWPLSRSRALTVWLAIDDANESNAALVFVDGSHRLGRLPWQSTEQGHHLLPQEIPDADLLGDFVTSELRAGEVSVHSDLTLHFSPPNAKGGGRRAGLALRFVQADARCLGPMLNGYRMNAGCILPKGQSSDPAGHWKAARRRKLEGFPVRAGASAAA